MIVSIKLGPNVQCEKICQTVQELINSYTKQNINVQDRLLVISIKEPIDDNSLIPKLEHKNT